MTDTDTESLDVERAVAGYYVRMSRQEAFGQEPPKIGRVGQGIHNGIFYFGATTLTGRQAVITSDKTTYMVRCCVEDAPKGGKQTRVFYDDIKDVFGLNYRVPMEPQLCAYTWRNSTGPFSRMAWLDGVAPVVDTAELHAEIREQFEKYIDFQDPRLYSVVACDVMADYVNCIFESRGITHLWGFRGSGKTKASRLYKFMGFNVLMSSKITPAALYRTVEANCPRVIIDNFDYIKAEELRAAYDQALQTGWEWDGVAHACDTENKNAVVAWSNFAPYLVNNITTLDPTTEDRALKITMLKTSTEKGKLRPDAEDAVWANIRDRCHVWALQTWGRAKAEYDSLESTLNNRERDVAAAILTIAKLAGGGVYEEVAPCVSELLTEKAIKDFSEDWEYLSLKEMDDRLRNDAGEFMAVADIAEAVGGGLFAAMRPEEQAKQLKKFKRWLPGVVAKLPMFTRKRTVGGRVEVFVTREAIKKAMILREFTDPADVTGVTVVTDTAKKLEKWRTALPGNSEVHRDWLAGAVKLTDEEISQLCRDGAVFEVRPGHFKRR